jgi:Fe-S-cluster containining protein
VDLVEKRRAQVAIRQLDPIARLYADIKGETRRLHVLHEDRLQCQRGCAACCVDDLTVFEVEAANIRKHHAELLATGAPHREGACAFLDEGGACRIYAERPYVCRTQGLPLRWEEERSDGTRVELRDICPLNDEGEPVEALAAEDCWSLGPIEERLGTLQLAAGRGVPRTRLRDLFVKASNGLTAPGSPSFENLEPKRVNRMGDKSPKAKDKSKKQHTADKNQKHAAAVEKAKAPPAGAGKRTK